jgi:hypothetical protein
MVTDFCDLAGLPRVVVGRWQACPQTGQCNYVN